MRVYRVLLLTALLLASTAGLAGSVTAETDAGDLVD